MTNMILNNKHDKPMGFSIKRGPTIAPIRLLIYGENGVGKSTFANHFQKPLFLDIEHNIDHIDCESVYITSFSEIKKVINAAKHGSDVFPYKTIVFDAVESLEYIMQKHVALDMGYGHFEDISYGRGPKALSRLLKDFLTDLNALSRHLNFVFIGHATDKNKTPPKSDAFMAVIPRMSDYLYHTILDWCNCIFYFTNRVSAVKKKAVSSERVMFTVGNDGYIAKNIFGLPPEMPIDWDAFMGHVKKFYTHSIPKKDEIEVDSNEKQQ